MGVPSFSGGKLVGWRGVGNTDAERAKLKTGGPTMGMSEAEFRKRNPLHYIFAQKMNANAGSSTASSPKKQSLGTLSPAKSSSTRPNRKRSLINQTSGNQTLSGGATLLGRSG